mmetsp:Transcript_109316/g.172716  ORF Transcript_109316/g.172716 Transcript_109316/m.172716 type:complete len:286 (+) Transcript_109316:437-1294(+)
MLVVATVEDATVEDATVEDTTSGSGSGSGTCLDVVESCEGVVILTTGAETAEDVIDPVVEASEAVVCIVVVGIVLVLVVVVVPVYVVFVLVLIVVVPVLVFVESVVLLLVVVVVEVLVVVVLVVVVVPVYVVLEVVVVISLVVVTLLVMVVLLLVVVVTVVVMTSSGSVVSIAATSIGAPIAVAIDPSFATTASLSAIDDNSRSAAPENPLCVSATVTVTFAPLSVTLTGLTVVVGLGLRIAASVSFTSSAIDSGSHVSFAAGVVNASPGIGSGLASTICTTRAV